MHGGDITLVRLTIKSIDIDSNIDVPCYIGRVRYAKGVHSLFIAWKGPLSATVDCLNLTRSWVGYCKENITVDDITIQPNDLPNIRHQRVRTAKEAKKCITTSSGNNKAIVWKRAFRCSSSYNIYSITC